MLVKNPSLKTLIIFKKSAIPKAFKQSICRTWKNILKKIRY